MVAEQLEGRDIVDRRVLDAMGRVPRELFVERGGPTRRAYEDMPLRIGHGQTISQPYMVALICQTADVHPDDRVLDIGTGSGYQAAVLAELGGATCTRSSGSRSWRRRREENLARAGFATGAPFTSATARSACPSTRRSTRSPWLRRLRSSRWRSTSSSSGRSPGRPRREPLRPAARADRAAAPKALPFATRCPAASCRSSARAGSSASRPYVPTGWPAAANLSGAWRPDPKRAPSRTSAFTGAAAGALRRPANWIQLAKFCAVGASGYIVNLAVYATLLAVGVHFLAAAVCSFLVAVTNNYIWNRLWTFRHQRGHLVFQGFRFLAVSTIALGANLAFLSALVARRRSQAACTGRRDRARHAVELRRQQALELPTAARRLIGLGAGSRALALALAGPAAAEAPTAPVYDSKGNLVGTPFVARGRGAAPRPRRRRDRARAGRAEGAGLARPLPRSER